MVSRTAPLQLAPGAGRAASQAGRWAPRCRAQGLRLVHPRPRPYLGELGDLLAHFQVHVLAVVHAVPRLLPGGRRGDEFGRRAAVIVLLPAHARGRHLPGRPRPGRGCPRSGGGPPSLGYWDAGARAAASGPDTRPRPPAAAARTHPPAISWSPPSRDGGGPAGPKPRATRARGRCPGPEAARRGPISSRPLFSSRQAGATRAAWPRRFRSHWDPGPSETAAAGVAEGGGARAGSCGGRRGHGGSRGSRGAAVTRARGPRSARGGDVISPQPSSAPRRRGPRSLAAGAGAFRRAGSQCFPRSWGRSPPRPSCRPPEVSPVCRAGQRRRGRGDLRCAERVQTYPAFPRASSRALGPSGSSPRRAANSHPARS